MAQGGIRKGFFFYFGLFVLLLIAIFLIILVVLFFNPGKTICWMQYFAKGSEAEIMATTDEEKTPIVLAGNGKNVNRIEVDCSYANVYVTVTRDVTNDMVKIVNNASGFATYKQARPYEYSVTLEDGTLKISVTEPVGFLYFSKDIEITIAIQARYNDGDVKFNGQFDNTEFDITTTSGNVYLGKGGERNFEIRPGDVTAKTTSGDIILADKFSTANIEKLALETGSGDISVGDYNVIIGDALNPNAKGLKMNAGTTLSLSTDTGLLDFDIVEIASSSKNVIDITNKNGNITIGNIDVGTGKVQLRSTEGNYYLDNITASELSFTPSEDILKSPNIKIGTLDGDFTMSASKNISPNVTIEKINGEFRLISGSDGDGDSFINGSYKIGEIGGLVDINSQKGVFDIGFRDGYSSKVNIITTSGNITLNFLGASTSDVDLITDSGKVTINVVDETYFKSTATDSETNSLLEDDKIEVNIGEYTKKNPLAIGSGGADISIFTGGRVVYNKI